MFADSLAALSTSLEMEGEDKYGMRRAKEFSEQCRKTCRILTKNNILMICSNQIRQSLNTYGDKEIAPGGKAIGFYSSLRLRVRSPKKIKTSKTINGKKYEKISGIEVEIDIFKSTVWEPYHKASIFIEFNYGIDDIRANLQYIKDNTKNTIFTLEGQDLSNKMEKAIKIIEQDNLENKLKTETIKLWTSIYEQLKVDRKSKR